MAMKYRLLSAFLFCGLMAGIKLPAAPQDDMTAKAKAALVDALTREEKFIKVHAAESLIANGEAARVREVFQHELERNGNEPALRNGIWRVLAGAASTAGERERSVARIAAVFVDEAASDRLVALESLNKLGCKLEGKTLAAAQAYAQRPVAEAAFAWWALYLAGQEDALPHLREALGSADAIARLRAAYVLRWEKIRDAESLAALARTADQEPHDAIGYAIIVSSALVLNADSSRAGAWRAACDDVLAQGAPGDRYQVCLALQDKFERSDLAKLEALLAHPHGDVRIGAATAILAMAKRSTTGSVSKPRGLWFWGKPASPYGSTNVVGNGAAETEALETFRRWNVQRLYGSYGAMVLERADAVAAWNRKLHAAGVRSESLFSDNAAITPKGRAGLLRLVEERVVQFNRLRSDPSERFDGIALDIEPHAETEWKTATPEKRREMMEALLSTCVALREFLDKSDARDLTISAALAYWLDRLPPGGKIAWKSPPDRDEWFTRLGRTVGSISLMAYERSKAEGINEAVAWEQSHFPARTITALRVRMGVEWKTIADLQRVLPQVEADAPAGIDLENYELLRLAEATAKR